MEWKNTKISVWMIIIWSTCTQKLGIRFDVSNVIKKLKLLKLLKLCNNYSFNSIKSKWITDKKQLPENSSIICTSAASVDRFRSLNNFILLAHWRIFFYFVSQMVLSRWVGNVTELQMQFSLCQDDIFK